MYKLSEDKFYEDMNKALKIFNSNWYPSDIYLSMNNKGQKFASCSIITGYNRNPDMGDCLAIAEYTGSVYRNGYFFKKIMG